MIQSKNHASNKGKTAGRHQFDSNPTRIGLIGPLQSPLEIFEIFVATLLQAEHAGKHNVSFLSYFMLGQLEKCLQILLDSNRIPEAAFFARTYLPSEISRIVELWREQLSKVNEKAGQSLADPKVTK